MTTEDAAKILQLVEEHTHRSAMTAFWEWKGRPQWMVDAGWVRRLFDEGEAPPGIHEFSGNGWCAYGLIAAAKAVASGDEEALRQFEANEMLNAELLELRAHA